MTTADIDPALAELAAGRLAGQPAELPPLPTPRPRPGQSADDWRAEVAAARRRYDDLATARSAGGRPGPAVGQVADHRIPVDGAGVAARVYTPEGGGPHPAVVFFHGGAFWLAGGEACFAQNDALCRVLCAGLGSVVVNVDYRLAPEHPYPEQLHDCFAAVEWVVGSAAALAVDPGNVSVMGASSGGNQAAAVCLLARWRGGPAVRSQTLLVPALDFTGASPSVQEDPVMALGLAAVATLYAGPEQWTDPLVSPLLAEDLQGLPPTVIVTGAHDGLRDDGRRYAERLAAAGVDVWWREYPMLHDVALPETLDRLEADVVAAVGAVQSGRPLSAP